MNPSTNKRSNPGGWTTFVRRRLFLAIVLLTGGGSRPDGIAKQEIKKEAEKVQEKLQEKVQDKLRDILRGR